MRSGRVVLPRLFAVALIALILLAVGLPLVGARDLSGADLPSFSQAATSRQQKPVVHFYLYYSETCPHCHEVMQNYLPKVYEKYGAQVEHQDFDIYNNNEIYVTMLGLEKKLGVPDDQQGYVPALFIGDKALIGRDEIPAKLETYIDEYLAKGGVDYPSLQNLPKIVLPTPEPAVQALVFFDQNQADFARLQSLIAALQQKYGSKFQAFAMDLAQPENVDKLAQLNAKLGGGRPAAGTPEMLVDRTVLVGMAQIEAQLPGLIDKYLAQGGVTVPPWEELIGAGSSGTLAPGQKPIHIAYFEKAGCQECARTSYDLSLVQGQYPQVEVTTYAIEDATSKALNEWLSEKHGVPVEKRLSTPMLFVGQDVLIGTDAALDNLLAVVSKYAQSGAERTWDDFDPSTAEKSLVDRFRSFGALTVVGAGLVDGLNPCAFATLVFFISYMAFTGRRGRDILFVGISFALGVFLTYLLVGVGLLKVVQSLSFFTALGRWVYLLTALLCIILAAFTFRDFGKARKGQASEMTLKLPMILRRHIHKVIREGAQVRAFVAMAFVTGFVVSLIELACTGQVYLPTVMFVLSVPELAAKAFLYLLLYCVMFIVPLVAVFVLSYLGTTSEQLGAFVNRHTATIKLLTGLLFVGLALWMTWTLAPLFGINAPWTWILLIGVGLVIALGAVVLRLTQKEAPKRRAPQRRRSRA